MVCKPQLIGPIGFTLEDAFALLNEVVTDHNVTQPGIDQLGIVAGLLVLNEEPEVVVKFMHSIEQFNHAEFHARFRIVKDDEA